MALLLQNISLRATLWHVQRIKSQGLQSFPFFFSANNNNIKKQSVSCGRESATTFCLKIKEKYSYGFWGAMLTSVNGVRSPLVPCWCSDYVNLCSLFFNLFVILFDIYIFVQTRRVTLESHSYSLTNLFFFYLQVCLLAENNAPRRHWVRCDPEPTFFNHQLTQ